MDMMPRKSRRRFTAGLAATLALAAGAPAMADDNRPFQIIVGFAPGGGTDVLARVLAIPLAKVLGRPVTVRNVPGASGQIAATALLQEGNEGLSVLAINHPDLGIVAARNTAPFKGPDFQVLVVDMQDPRVFLVKNDSGIADFAAFVARAKAEPGKLSVSVAAGTAQELFAKWLFGKLGVDVTIVGYKGGSEAATALLAGDVTANIGDDFSRAPLRQQTRALFIGSGRKSPRWAEAPALASVLAPYNVAPPSAEFMSRFGVYVVPAALKAKSPALYAKLQQALLKSRESPEFQAYLNQNKLQDQSIGKRGEELDAVFAADMVEIGKIK